MNNSVLIYSTRSCPYCLRAKQLLTRKGIAFEEIDITGRDDLEREMTRITGRQTVPQILIAGTPIGGCDDLYDLDRRGELDRLLRMP